MGAIEELCKAVLGQTQPGSDMAGLVADAREELTQLRARVAARNTCGHQIVIDRNLDEPHFWTACCGGCGWSGTPVEFELEARVQFDLHIQPTRTDA